MAYINQLIKFLNQAQTNDLHTASYINKLKGLSVKVSFGQANKAKVPWIAFLHKDQKVSEGIYPVYLYYSKYSMLILAYGISETNAPELFWKVYHTKRIENIIDVKKYAYRYGKSYVFKKYLLDFSVDNYGLDENEIEEDLSKIIEKYQLVLRQNKINEIKEEEEIRKEGRVKVITSLKAERNKILRKKALQYHGTKCKICGFDFEKAFGGKYGRNFIEIHHIYPLSRGGKYVERNTNYKTDLVPVCANCHRIIHRKRNEVLSIEILRSILNKEYIHE